MLQQVLGLDINVKLAALRVLGEVESRDLGHVLILALTLLLLQLERDAADGSTLDTLHQVGGVAGNLWVHVSGRVFAIRRTDANLVAEALRGDNSNLIADPL